MSKYTVYSKKQFEIELISACSSQKLGFFQEVKLENTKEYCYTISTKNKAVDILIFSSVDVRTGKTRENGEDAVRLVLRWATKNGIFYKKIAKHLRVENLFKNMVKTIKKHRENVFNLNAKEFEKQENDKMEKVVKTENIQKVEIAKLMNEMEKVEYSGKSLAKKIELEKSEYEMRKNHMIQVGTWNEKTKNVLDMLFSWEDMENEIQELRNKWKQLRYQLFLLKQAV